MRSISFTTQADSYFFDLTTPQMRYLNFVTWLRDHVGNKGEITKEQQSTIEKKLTR